MSYTHLTVEERYQIYALMGKQCTVSDIGEALGRDKGTISRELKRNRGGKGYRPKQAQALAEVRRQETHNARQIPFKIWAIVETMLRQEHSPEQVSGRLRRCTGEKISHETIYQHIYTDKRMGGNLHQHLRCQKKRRKRYGSGRTHRGHIPNRVGIEERCPRVEKRMTIGHWEGDTVMGKNNKGALVTHFERRSRLARLRKVKRKTAKEVAKATIKVLLPLARLVKSITNDNGTEFTHHRKVSKSLNAKIYFAHPYSSWERGTNENGNGLIRQYFPKGSSFEDMTDEQVAFVEDRLNDRPRKCLDYETPREVITRSSKSRGVALRT